MLKKFLIAGYGLPAEIGITVLFGMGILPNQIAILTHPMDDRNKGLFALAHLRGLAINENSTKNPNTLAWVQNFEPDYILSLHYRNLIPLSILKCSKHGCLNLHPSLLPEYRGTNSVAWAIINGEQETGYTFHYMDETFDTGNILFQEKIKIEKNDTAFSLFHRQILRAMSKFEPVINKLLSGELGTPQPKAGSYYKRELPFNGLIDIRWPTEKIERFIRAMVFPPFPPAKLIIDNIEYQIPTYEAYIEIAKHFHLIT